jgi:hypothetical protein
VKLRACGHSAIFRPRLEQLQITDIVQLLPVCPYREALTEIMESDGLLVLQAANCNHQVPAKIYEYFRAARPILALTDPEGDTAWSIRQAAMDDIAPLDDPDAISAALMAFIEKIERNEARIADEAAVKRSSRRHAAELLGGLFDSVAEEGRH